MSADFTRNSGSAMPEVVVCVESVGKRFCRSWPRSLRYGLADALRRTFRRPPRALLREHEFWAVDGVSLTVHKGECLGVIGPNGAGKSTLLKLIAREYRPDHGAVHSRGRVQSLIRLGTGLQPLLSGRENVYIRCSELGLAKPAIEAKLAEIVAFAELDAALDRPVRYYSDGMYARLEFAIATSVPVDVLLIDEVLAVGDIAFQVRCLDRLNALKQRGVAIVLVSHAEMNIRQVADRCLLLFDGKSLVQGATDAVICKYHEAIGYSRRPTRVPGASVAIPEDRAGPVAITAVGTGATAQGAPTVAAPGDAIEWMLDYRSMAAPSSLELVLQFWNSADILVASVDSRYSGELRLAPGTGRISVRLPFLALAPGLYRIAGGFMQREHFVSYRRSLAALQVIDTAYTRYGGLAVMPAAIAVLPTDRG